MKEEQKVFVGMKLYRELMSRNSPTKIIEVTVSKIGRLYFRLEEYRDETKFNMETLKYECFNYSQNNIQLYNTEQEILDINDRSELLARIKTYFSYWGGGRENTLEQLREVAKILGI